MTLTHFMAGVVVAAVFGVGAVGLVAHLAWLAVTDRGELAEVLGMLWEVVTG